MQAEREDCVCVARMGVRPLGRTINMELWELWELWERGGGGQTDGSPPDEPMHRTAGMPTKVSQNYSHAS